MNVGGGDLWTDPTFGVGVHFRKASLIWSIRIRGLPEPSLSREPFDLISRALALRQAFAQ